MQLELFASIHSTLPPIEKLLGIAQWNPPVACPKRILDAYRHLQVLVIDYQAAAAAAPRSATIFLTVATKADQPMVRIASTPPLRIVVIARIIVTSVDPVRMILTILVATAVLTPNVPAILNNNIMNLAFFL
ncbi:hypothetical protein MT990_02605 [Bifidobacterium longum subsp. infantis]|nr:hypothetical protein [Bifidobacterium longum]UOG11282.1 hypothetical protein MT990_02605 [Bifidobacterium longum subsp. infantis]